jgi:hypothetical protein
LNKKKQMELLDADSEEVAFLLTLLIKAIAPAVDKAATYELVYELLGEGMGEDIMEVYGALIRATAFRDKQEIH